MKLEETRNSGGVGVGVGERGRCELVCMTSPQHLFTGVKRSGRGGGGGRGYAVLSLCNIDCEEDILFTACRSFRRSFLEVRQKSSHTMCQLRQVDTYAPSGHEWVSRRLRLKLVIRDVGVTQGRRRVARRPRDEPIKGLQVGSPG